MRKRKQQGVFLGGHIWEHVLTIYGKMTEKHITGMFLIMYLLVASSFIPFVLVRFAWLFASRLALCLSIHIDIYLCMSLAMHLPLSLYPPGVLFPSPCSIFLAAAPCLRRSLHVFWLRFLCLGQVAARSLLLSLSLFLFLSFSLSLYIYSICLNSIYWFLISEDVFGTRALPPLLIDRLIAYCILYLLILYLFTLQMRQWCSYILQIPRHVSGLSITPGKPAGIAE